MGIHRWVPVIAALLALGFLCPGNVDIARADAPPAEVVWQGDVLVNESVSFDANQTLIILPGTNVRIKTIAPSCTEGSAPVVTVAGNLIARGNGTARITFTSVTDQGEVCAAGREALLVYSGAPGRDQSLYKVDFTGGSLLGYRTALRVRDCTFNQTGVRLSADNSSIENCAFRDSTLSVFPRSGTVIANNTFTRGARDDAAIYLYDSAEVMNNTITNCVSGIEASIWIAATVSGNTISGCLEAVNSTGLLELAGNDLSGNVVGVRSWAGLDRLDGNFLGGNDVGVISLGRLYGVGNNTFRAAGRAPNRLADIQEMVLASGGCVDGNGQKLLAPVNITDSTGRTVFSGDPEFVPLIAYERLSDGSERRYSPFTARATYAGASNSTTLAGNYSVSFSIRLELYPELSVRAFRGAFSGVTAGSQVPMTIQVRNTGAAAARNFRVTAFVDGEPAFVQHVNSLNPGEGRNLTFEWTARSGKHTFRALADSSGTVAELSEKDNARAFSSSIRPTAPVDLSAMALPSVLVVAVGAFFLFGRRRSG